MDYGYGYARTYACRGWFVGRNGSRTAYVAELPILKYQKLLPPTDFLEACDGAVGEVFDDIGVGFKHAYRVADFFCELEEGGGGGDVGGDAQIGALNGD